MTNKEKKTELGVVKINNEVIASIAKSAALEVDGVIGIKRNPLTLLNDFINKGYNNKGIKLEISENEVKVGITVVVKYGINIPEIANAVQENIRTTIEEMTGLLVSEVNVNIADIHAEKFIK